jgi:uncharacterized protein
MELFAYEADGKGLRPDLKKLLVSRMLIQANSGGGKSHTIRKLCEILHGHVQQIIIDTEGEFSTLREKYDYVICAAQGGDAIAHPKTAKLLAERLLETGVSAIIDIYELKPHERHSFVRIFLDAMVNAPKALWHPVVVVLDEAHVYAPETDKSEALGSVADIATRGRKRGFCLVAATQRISKLSKDVAAELNNKLIGRTSLDVDVKRAAAELGINAKDALTTLRELEPGNFYAFGPAIGHVPRMVSIGPVETRHPKSGDKYQAPPKPTAAILAVLPKLADLPKESEEKAKTEADLRRELADVSRELSTLKKAAVRTLETGKAHIRLKDDGKAREMGVTIKRLRAALEMLMKFVVTIHAKDFAMQAGGSAEPVKIITEALDAAVAKAMKMVDGRMESRGRELKALQDEGKRIVDKVAKMLAEDVCAVDVTVQNNPPFSVTEKKTNGAAHRQHGPKVGETYEDGGISNPQKKVLRALAWLLDKGIEPAPKNTVAAVAGVSPTSGSYANNLSALKTAGMIDYPQAGMVGFTDKGLAITEPVDASGDVHEKWLEILSGPQRKILEALIEAHPNERGKAELASTIGVSDTSGSYANNLSSLKTLGAIEYPQKGFVRLTKYVMPE